MRSFVLLSVVLAGCAARYKTEHVGVAQVVGHEGSIALGRGDYQMSMRFDVPRAQIVAWTLRCPGIERTGVAGETFENYRARRLVDINRRVEQDRRGLATVTNAIAGQAGAQVQLRGPGTTVTAEAVGPSGEAVAQQVIEDVRELPYGDVGAGSYLANLQLRTFDDGACTVTTNSLDPVGGTLAVDRIRDLRAEAQQRQVAQRANAIDARARVRARLVGFGADEQARAHRLAEARRSRDEANRLRLEAEARIRWEAGAPERERQLRIDEERRARGALEQEAERVRRARLDAERNAKLAIEAEAERSRLLVIEEQRRARLVITEEELRMRLVIIEEQRTRAFAVRGTYIAWLVGTCNADLHRRARLEAERIERTRRIELEREQRERTVEIERERIARERQAREERTLQVAFAVRTQLAGYLVTAGARLRPPRPAARIEIAGSAPFEGARWESGTWMWLEGTWQWRQGGWVDSVQFGAAGGESYVRAPDAVREVEVAPTTTQAAAEIDVSVPSRVTIGVPGVQGSISIGATRTAPRARSTVRDHQRPEPKADAARVRDHRRR